MQHLYKYNLKFNFPITIYSLFYSLLLTLLLHKQSLLEDAFDNDYFAIVMVRKDFNALSLIISTDLVAYVSGQSLEWGPWWTMAHVSGLRLSSS